MESRNKLEKLETAVAKKIPIYCRQISQVFKQRRSDVGVFKRNQRNESSSGRAYEKGRIRSETILIILFGSRFNY